MNKLVTFFVLLSLFYSTDVTGQDTIAFDEIVIEGKRHATTWREAARPVQLIQAKDILSAPAHSFEELLSYSSGLDVQQRGPHGIQANLSIRGGTFEQALLLVNGVRMSDIQTGHHHLNLPLAPMAVERIEIVKGPAARRYGQNAYAGAVNIITAVPKKDELFIQASYGDFGTLNVGGQLGLAGEKSSHLVQLNYAQSDGYRYNTDYHKANVWYQNVTETNFGRLKFQGGFTEKDFGANAFYASPDFVDQYEEVETAMVSAEAEIIRSKWDINPRAYWRWNQDMYVFNRERPSDFRNFHLNNVVGIETNANYADQWGGTGVGFDIRREYLVSNNLGPQDRTVLSFFFEKNIDLLDDRLHLSPGFTWSDFTDFGSFFYPGIDIGYELNREITLFGNVGQTYRVPSFTDLYYEDRANLGNANLVPEEALAYELGFRKIDVSSNLTFSLFRRETENLIDWTKENSDDRWQPFNISELNTNGLELQYERLIDHPFFNKVGLGYTYLDNNLAGNSAPFSRYALNNLRHQLSVTVKHDIIPGRLSHHLVYRYNDRIALEDYNVVDSRIDYNFEKWQLFAMINNVLDEEYRESNLVPMPGRWFRMGVTLRLDL